MSDKVTATPGAVVVPVFMSSRRTIMSGEVVTFATEFIEEPTPFETKGPAGPFEVSASRDAVVVHKANCRDETSVLALVRAINAASFVMKTLASTHSGGHPSKYPKEPTEIPGEGGTHGT